jgi:hypothetical protein
MTSYVPASEGTVPGSKLVFPLKILGVAPVSFLAFLIVVYSAELAARPSFADPIYQPAFVLFVNTVIFRLMFLLVAYFAAKSYLQSGLSNLLMFGAGAFTYSVSGVTGSYVGTYLEGPNALNVISGIGSLLASVIFFAGALVTFRGVSKNGRPSHPLVRLALMSIGVVAFVLVLALLSFEGFAPAFTNSSGPTELATLVRISTATLFAGSSLLFLKFYLKSSTNILYWYILSLALLAVGSASAIFPHATGDLLSWSGRLASYTGAVYSLAAVLSALGAATKGATRRRR